MNNLDKLMETAGKNIAKMIDANKLIEWVHQQDCEIRFLPVHQQSKMRGIYSPIKNKIQELLIELDPDGWCYDMEKAPKDKEVIVTDGYSAFTAKYRKSNIQNYFPFFAKCCDGEFLQEGHDWECQLAYVYEPKAWQPLPTIPERRK